MANRLWNGSILILLNCLLATTTSWAQNNSVPLPSVDPGSKIQAEFYFRRLSVDLGFLSTNTILSSKLDDVLDYLGYNGLHAVDLDKLTPEILMDYGQLKSEVSDATNFAVQFPETNALPKGNILATQFFAPKITDDSHLPPNAYGWRKLIRLLPVQKSTESISGKSPIVAAFILYNYFQPDLNKSPFDVSNLAVNIQVALVTAKGAPNLDPIYWLDYDPAYNIHFDLDAFFDARDPVLPKKPYFVPNACVACHNNQNKPLLNYLDTDYWIDRAQSDDFSSFRASALPVLFDAGTRDETGPQYLAAFDIIRQLNTEIGQQNASTSSKSSMAAASKNWLTLHAGSAAHVQPIDRAIPTPPATQKWTKGNSDDETILPLLNQYCFRCHGSVSYNVFDKGAVLFNALKMKTYIEADYSNSPAERRQAMPPDRELPAAQKKLILDFLNKTLQQP